MAIMLCREADVEFRCFGMADEYPKNLDVEERRRA